MATNAVALTTGAPLLMVLSRLRGEEWALPTTWNTWAAFGYLVLIGSVGVSTLYLTVLSRWTASATSYIFLLMPATTVVIAAVVAGEVVTTSFFIGTALVLAGVWLGAVHAPPEEAESTCPGVPAEAACRLDGESGTGMEEMVRRQTPGRSAGRLPAFESASADRRHLLGAPHHSP